MATGKVSSDGAQGLSRLAEQAWREGLISLNAFHMMTDGAVSNRNMSQSGDALIQMERAVMEADANFQVSRGGEKEGTKLEQRREDRTLAQHLHNAVVEKLDSQPWWRTAFEEVKDLFTAIT